MAHNTDLMGNILSSNFIVTCNHDNPNARPFTILNSLFGLLTWGILDTEDAQHCESTFLYLFKDVLFSVQN